MFGRIRVHIIRVNYFWI